MKVAVLGLGYWGPNIVRNFLSTPGVDKVFACDLDEKRLKVVKSKFPSVELTNDPEFILSSPEIDAVAIATPVSTHYPLAKKALEHGKHVLVEKPMTSSVKEAEELIEISERKNLTLMVDHTFIFTGAVRKIKELIQSGEIGDIYYFDSVRVNLGLFQHDVNVIWDLATHDVSIMNYLIDSKPISVASFGAAHYNGIEDIAYIIVNFENGIIAHFHVNWLAPVKVRKILIGGTKKMIVYDDTEPSEKVKVYDKGVIATTQEGIHKMLISYRTGDMYAPKVDDTEALSLVCKNFIESIETGEKPITDGISGLKVVKILEAAEKSIKNNG
ncbi:MAG: Gfo/Idh/MocA family oxidoreductase, partial [Candidatus Kryptonium sp.]|nr:Gfo/Idh/MocA family oxidoreductase [Candidatus Kryptonium sp.]